MSRFVIKVFPYVSSLEKVLGKKCFLTVNWDNYSKKFLNFNKKKYFQVKTEDDVEAKKEDVEKADQETKDEAVEGNF